MIDDVLEKKLVTFVKNNDEDVILEKLKEIYIRQQLHEPWAVAKHYTEEAIKKGYVKPTYNYSNHLEDTDLVKEYQEQIDFIENLVRRKRCAAQINPISWI